MPLQDLQVDPVDMNHSPFTKYDPNSTDGLYGIYTLA